MAMDFSWLPPGQDVGRLPLGMRVNNPGNIKYNPKLGYGGMLGPSAHTDQGDAQMTFDTPQNGMTAMARLVRTKYKRGQTTPMSIIAGQGGWTPGNTEAAANVARTLGIDPNTDLGLNDPERMTAFLKALTRQEHGAASTLYGDDIYKNAVTGEGGGSMPYMTTALNAAGANPGAAPVAQPVAGTTGTLGGPLADFGRMPSERRKAMAEALVGQSFRTANSATNPLGALAAMVQAYAGKSLGGEYDDEKYARNRKLAEALYGAKDNDSLMRTMLASGDDELVKSAVGLKVAAAKTPTPTEWERRAIAGGLKPGTPEYQKFMLNGPPKPAKLEVADRKEIFEADEGAQAAANVMGSLDKALELNSKAYSGLGAQTRGYVSSLVGNDRGEATEELQNVVLQQVLDNLKATFGAAPTEGERQILVDIQGSVNKSPEVRRRIFDAAKGAAARRLQFNKERAGALRSGDYYNPGYSPSSPAAAPSAPEQSSASAPPASSAKAPPSIRPEAVTMLKGDPSPLKRQQFDAVFGAGAADRVLRSAPASSAATAQELQSVYGMAP